MGSSSSLSSIGGSTRGWGAGGIHLPHPFFDRLIRPSRYRKLLMIRHDQHKHCLVQSEYVARMMSFKERMRPLSVHDGGISYPLGNTFTPYEPVAWSNGRFCNVKHRVQCYEPTIRTSIALFVLAPNDEKVEAPPQLVDSDHPRCYIPFDFEDYRKLRSSTNSPTGGALKYFLAKSS
ncbi:2-oxoglutarate-dependent dioxygenase DAO [Sesamum angolense]|uniref:2-oxoglutarate-dependent dioxygenase DAO n=1 Tax=Sesamum angolense TaxID=2727404 RepID=A0AAE1W5V2_9LAMI|nr:2-oxoglutarate-dependent dioxygenase DAO [Sesamum angolense]